ncbi:hypothetical protein [Rhizobium leguminosarum]|uniref:hypothetical protein n=1 Tax=Rhizobium leguminosarum TaxID=384 RepID=UPI001AE4538D|nr:hypothetical protein [Rhizobium leguminosarum]MBP2445081.1 hypothetical protein [Rhizobium leguminosarum]
MTNVFSENFPDLEACYGQLIGWCDLLEAIADFLPCRVEDRLCETIINGLVPLLSTTHPLEEQVISSHLGLIMIDDELTEAAERRRTSRLFDADAAQEVVDTLCELKAGRCHLSWDAIGYLLRSFFCSMRRHIKAEREIVRQILKALARQVSQPAAVAIIEAA